MKCPGQDTQYWGAGAIFEAVCPDCGATVEFFKDDTHARSSAVPAFETNGHNAGEKIRHIKQRF